MQLFCQRHSVTRVWPASLKQWSPVILIKQWKENRVAALRTHSPHTHARAQTHTWLTFLGMHHMCTRAFNSEHGRHARSSAWMHTGTSSGDPGCCFPSDPHVTAVEMASLIRLLSVVWETWASAWATVYIRMKQICLKAQYVRFSSNLWWECIF